MTKDDFIKEVQKLDGTARKEFVDQSTAPPVVKEAAKRGEVKAARPEIPRIVEHHAESSEQPMRSESISPGRGRSTATKPAESAPAPAPASRTGKSSKEQGETAVERRRRLAVLASQGEVSEKDESPEGHGDTGETPAERRRREAALGLGGADSDSEDEGGERVPPARRGIRFAEPSRR
jgi:hypothetical protein